MPEADDIVARIDDPATEAAYQEDRALRADRGGIADRVPGQGREHRRAVRYTAPSLLFTHRDGRALEAGGFQPVEAYDVIVANLDPTLTRRGPAEDPVDVLAALPYALTTREVAAAMAPHLAAPDDDAAEALLIEAAGAGRARRQTVGGGALWHHVPG